MTVTITLQLCGIESHVIWPTILGVQHYLTCANLNHCLPLMDLIQTMSPGPISVSVCRKMLDRPNCKVPNKCINLHLDHDNVVPVCSSV